MGESIRLLMVATLSLAAAQVDCNAQMPPPQTGTGNGGITLPSAFRGFGESAGNLAQQAQAKIDAVKSMPFPGSNSGLVGPPTRPRNGVPTTEPAPATKNWASNPAAGRNNLPSTDPVLPPANGAPNASTRSIMNPFSRSTASQNAAIDGNAMHNGAERTAPTGFGDPRLDPNSAARNAAARNATPTMPPGTSADWPNNTQAPRASSESSSRFDLAAASNATATGTLGEPQYRVPPGFGDEWTPEHIRTLCEYFGIQPNDPILYDRQKMEKLHAEYKQRERQRLVEAAAEQDRFNLPPGSQSQRFLQSSGAQQAAQPELTAQNQAAASAWNLKQNWLVNPPAVDTTGTTLNPANPNGLADRGRTALDRYGFASGQGISQPAMNASMPTYDPALSKRDVDSLPRNGYSFDKYGNPVDRRGNLLDRRGNVIDDIDEIYRLTTGRAIKEHEAKLAQQAAQTQAAQTQAAQTQAMVTATNTIPGYPTNVNIPPTFRPNGAIPVASRQQGFRGDEDQLAAGSPSDQLQQTGGQTARRPAQADQAGLGGSTNGLGKSNPLVNGLLLISILSNGFLMVWMHRLWYRHRDLIASSRKVSSGISSTD